MPGAPLISAVGPMSHSGQPAQPQHQHPHMHMALPPQPPPPQQPPHAVMSGMPGMRPPATQGFPMPQDLMIRPADHHMHHMGGHQMMPPNGMQMMPMMYPMMQG